MNGAHKAPARTPERSRLNSPPMAIWTLYFARGAKIIARVGRRGTLLEATRHSARRLLAARTGSNRSSSLRVRGRQGWVCKGRNWLPNDAANICDLICPWDEMEGRELGEGWAGAAHPQLP